MKSADGRVPGQVRAAIFATNVRGLRRQPQIARRYFRRSIMPMNRQILLAARPEAAPEPQHFRLAETPVPQPGDGQVLLKTLWLSLDPYMRGRMSAARSYAKPVEVGEPMVGGTVNEVVASKHPDFKRGDVVLGYAGWQDYAVSDGAGLRKLDARRAPVSTALG